MSEARNIAHKRILIGTLVLSLSTLPFSVKLCHLFIIIMVASWLLEGEWNNKITIIKKSLLLQLFIAFFCLQMFGLLFSENLLVGWLSLEKKIFLLVLPICIATTSVRLRDRELKMILAAFVFACFAGSIYCIFYSVNEAHDVFSGKSELNPYLSGSAYSNLHPFASETWVLFSYVSLAAGMDIHPTYFSVYLAFCVVVLLNEFIPASGFKKIGASALIIYFSVFIVFLASRVVILSVGVLFLIVLLRSLIEKEKSVTLIVSGTLIAFCYILLVNPVTRYRSLQEFGTSTFRVDPGTNYTNATEIRFSLWWTAIKSLVHWNPIVGYGTGDVEQVMQSTSENLQITNSIYSRDPHNQFLYTLLGNGTPALLTLMLCFGLPIYWGRRQSNFLLWGFSFVFLLACLTESILELQKGIVFYSLVGALFFFQLNSFQNISINYKSLLHVSR